MNYKTLKYFFRKKKKINIDPFFNENKINFKIIDTHKNDTILLFFEEIKIYRKINKNKEGIKKIRSEYNGLKWYIKILGKKKKIIIDKIKQKKNFIYLDLKEIKGKKAKSWRPLEENFIFIKKTLSHYNRYWPKKKLFNIHGDLTLDNIIFKKNELFILDWEFFNSKKSFRGYDIAYLILSSVCIPYITDKIFTDRDKTLFIYLWRELLKKKYDFNKNMLINPFKFFKKKILTDPTLNKSLKLSKSKFFPFIIEKKFQIRILEIINSIKYE